MKTTSLKTRILIPLTLALIILLGAFIFNVYRIHRREITNNVEKQLESVEELYEKQLSSDTQLMEATIEMLSFNPLVQAAWLAKDRAELLRLSLPLLEKLQIKYQITHFYFHDINRTNFLRVYEPTRRGGIINRYTLMQTEKTGQPSAGAELGELGTFTLRVVYPWRIDGKVVGYIELGKEIDIILEKLRDILGVELYISIYKEFLDYEKWQDGMKILGHKARWDQLDESVIISQTLKVIPKIFSDFLSEGHHEYMEMEPDIELLVEGKNYRVGVIALYDAGMREIGDMIIMYDVTEQIASARNSILIFIAICAIVGVTLFIFFSIILGRAEKQLESSRLKIIRAHNELEIKVKERTADLEATNEELKTFTYVISHDLRAPLVNIKGFASELRSAVKVISSVFDSLSDHLDEEQKKKVTLALTEDVPESLAFIDSSVTRMNNFASAILKLSRLGRRELDLQPVNIKNIINETLDTLAHQIEKRQVNVTVGSLPDVVADQISMEQVIGNILTNAVNYLHKDRPGKINISSERGQDKVTFHISDNGRGIAEQDMHKVFEPFRRAGKQDVPGEGMGLAYVQTILKHHGGTIWCKSKPGEETIFSFALPDDPSARS